MPWIGPTIGGAASLIGGMMQGNAQAANNATQVQLANKEMSWQTMMSDTAEQRHVADLKASGLNPALAYGTPAPVPGQAPIANTQAVTGPGAGVAGAGQIAAQASLSSAQTAKVQADADNVRADTATKLATLPYAGSTAQQNLANMQSQENVIRQQAESLVTQWKLGEANISSLNQNRDFQAQLQPLVQKLQALDYQRVQLGMPKLQNEAGAQSSWWMKNIAPYLPGGTSALDSAVNAASKVAPLVP